MRIASACICYLVVLLAALRSCQSTSGFVLLGVVPALFLDRYLFRLFPWSERKTTVNDLCRRVIYVIAGSSVAYLARFGLVPIQEAVLSGIFLSMAAFFVESVWEIFTQSVKRLRGPMDPRPGARGNGFLRNVLVVLALLAVGAPLEPLHPLRTIPKRTPAVVGLHYEDVQFVTQDGVKLAGWLVPHPQSRGNVIFCHGHGRNRAQGTGLLQTLHGLGLNVLVFDFRGHGGSSGHTASFGYREVRDLMAAEAFLRQRCPDRPLFLVGISYGAAVALQTLPQLPEVEAVWIEGCFRTLVPVVEKKFSVVPSWIRGSLVAAYESLAWLDCGFWGSDIRPGDQLRRVRIPIFFCHATEDELVPFAEGKSLYDAYAGPKASYWVPGASHYNIRRFHKDEYLAHLRDFLREFLENETR